MPFFFILCKFRGVYSSTKFYLIPPPLSVHLIPPPGLKGFHFFPHRRFIRVVSAFYACVCIKILRFFLLYLFHVLWASLFCPLPLFSAAKLTYCGKKLHFHCCLNDFSLIFSFSLPFFLFFPLNFFCPPWIFFPQPCIFFPISFTLHLIPPPAGGGNSEQYTPLCKLKHENWWVKVIEWKFMQGKNISCLGYLELAKKCLKWAKLALNSKNMVIFPY